MLFLLCSFLLGSHRFFLLTLFEGVLSFEQRLSLLECFVVFLLDLKRFFDHISYQLLFWFLSYFLRFHRLESIVFTKIYSWWLWAGHQRLSRFLMSLSHNFSGVDVIQGSLGLDVRLIWSIDITLRGFLLLFELFWDDLFLLNLLALL